MAESKSLNGTAWALARADDATVQAMMRATGLGEIESRLLCIRGVKPEDALNYLNLTFQNSLSNPFTLKGMKELCEDIAARIEDGRTIGVLGDFDVDGATSTAILVRFFRSLGIEVPFYIPDRHAEGYGPSDKALETLKASGCTMVVMVDCGTTAFSTIEKANTMGLDVAVLDHHEAEDKLPNAAHIINPKRKDDDSGLDFFAACGVSFMTCIALNATLRDRGYYEKHNIQPMDLRSLTDILALGTVCDMMPLDCDNRLFVQKGLQAMRTTENVGLRALMKVSGMGDRPPSAKDFGFALGPRINAGSRIHESDLGARLLTTEDEHEAAEIATTLNQCNEQRKEIQARDTSYAINEVKKRGLDNHPALLVEIPEGHIGVTGLVAGRLKDTFHKPACVITMVQNIDGEMEGRGSCRSIPGVDMGQVMIDARNAGLLEKGGGHKMAAGLTITPKDIPAFTEFYLDHIAGQLKEHKEPETIIDAMASIRGANMSLAQAVEAIGPFGQGNPEPQFLFQNIRIQDCQLCGKAQTSLKLRLADWEGGPWVTGFLFSAKDKEIGQSLMKNWRDVPFHVVGSLDINEYNGNRSVQIRVSDMAYAADGSVCLVASA